MNEIQEVEAEEEDNYACEICREENKLMTELISHKCPICNEELFCSHLLKEHMKIVHGWFNVQRRFQSH